MASRRYCISLFKTVLLIYLSVIGCAGSLFLCGLISSEQGLLQMRCVGCSLRWLLLCSMGSRARVGSVVVAHRLSCSMACGLLLD